MQEIIFLVEESEEGGFIEKRLALQFLLKQKHMTI
jgi:hypothetical protein